MKLFILITRTRVGHTEKADSFNTLKEFDPTSLSKQGVVAWAVIDSEEGAFVKTSIPDNLRASFMSDGLKLFR